MIMKGNQMSEIEQEQIKFEYAKVKGEPFTELPQDLYIPPDALEVLLETFEGPLDLLLYLIKRQNLDILDIPVAEITRQYMEYINLMEVLKLELAAEYLVMAAMLVEIKSRLLLPRPEGIEEEEDPRAELIRKLQEYECYKKVAEELNELPRRGRDTFAASVNMPLDEVEKPLPQIELRELILAFNEVLQRAQLKTAHRVKHEGLSVRERMSHILDKLKVGKFVSFSSFFDVTEGRKGLVVTFIAILELFRDELIEVTQTGPFAPIYVAAVKAGGINE
jgi:segregation and condensation protein A